MSTGVAGAPTPHTRALAEFAASAEPSPAALRAAQRLLLDTLGCIVGGHSFPSSRMVRAARTRGCVSAVGEATVLVSGEKVSCSAAAHVNGHAGNALDAEDTLFNAGHQSAATVPAALAVAELQGASGREVLQSIAVGFEVAARIGLSLQHLGAAADGTIQINPVSGLTWSAFGAAVAAGRLLRLGPEGMADAIGVTAWTAPGPTAGRFGRFRAPRPMSKYAMYGAMAEAGTQAAFLAEQGFVGDRTVLDGDFGFWRVMGSSGCNADVLDRDCIAEGWLVEDVSFKQYPSCRFSSASIDLASAIVGANRIAPQEILSIDLTVGEAATTQGLDTFAIDSEVDGQFSIPYLVALAVLGHPPGPRWHGQTLRTDRAVADLARRVIVSVDPHARAVVMAQLSTPPHQVKRMPATVTVTTRDRQFSSTTETAGGDPWDEGTVLDDAALESKFERFCADALVQDQVQVALRILRGFGAASGVHELVATLTAPDSATGGSHCR